MTVCVNQDILWLQITIDDVKLMDVFDGQYDLSNKEFRFILIKDLALIQVHSEISARTKVKDHIQIIGRLKTEVHLDDERVVCVLQNVALGDRIL